MPTPLPAATDYTAAANQAAKKTFMTNFRAFIAGLLGTSGDAADARTALGLVIGTNVQAYSANIPTTAASQAEMEAGTETALRAMSPKRISEAIAALAVSAKDTTARDQIALTNLRLLLNTAVATGALVQGKQWELATDEWGGTSTSETYVSSSPGYYSNAGSQSVIAGGTAQGGFTSNGGNAASFDGNTSQSASSSSVTPGTPSGYSDASAIGKDWGSGVTKTVSRLKMWSPTDAGYRGDNAAIGFKLQGSANNSTWVDLYAGTTPAGSTQQTVDVTSGIDQSTAYRYHRVVFNGNGTNGLFVCEVQFFETSSSVNMTLIPDAAVSVSAAPTYMDAYFLYKDDSGSAVLGTDLTVELSRDGGTTWTTATLTTLASFDGTYSAIKARADVSGQPSGTSMTCRIKTLNNKAQRVAAPALYAE